jgi:hypothetical protein
MYKNKIIISIAILFFSINLQGQSHTESYITHNRAFKINCEAQTNTSIKVSIFKNDSSDSLLVTYPVFTDNMEIFAGLFQLNISSTIRADSTIPARDSATRVRDSSNWLVFGRDLLRRYQNSLVNTSPLAGVFKISDSVSFHKFYSGPGNKRLEIINTVNKYKVVRFQAEINDGYLENCIASISNGRDIIKYIIPYPIGMSSINNFNKYADVRLYPLDSNMSPHLPNVPKHIYISLGELIKYNYELGVKRRDYSPKDTSFSMEGGTSLNLHKEETKKLFEAHIFTDFQGLNETKPNGLIQTEISKRININTVQHLPFKFLYPVTGSYGYLQHITPSISITKLEQHNKNLSLSDLDSVRLNPGLTDTSKFAKNYNRFSDALNMYQHQRMAVGADINLLYFNKHELKYNVYFNLGFRLGFTDVTDSLTKPTGTSFSKTGFSKQFSTSFILAYPEIKMIFLPEERFNFSLSHKWVYFKPISPDIQFVSYDKENTSVISPKTNSWLNISELLMTIQVNPNSKLFGRARLIWEAGNVKNNFSQIQLGYSTYILGNK